MVGTILGDKAYSEQYIADAPWFTGLFINSTKDRFGGDLEITGTEPIPDNGTKLYHKQVSSVDTVFSIKIRFCNT